LSFTQQQLKWNEKGKQINYYEDLINAPVLGEQLLKIWLSETLFL